MAKVQGMKEKLHLPLYDAFFVPKETTFGQEMERRDPRVIRFFVDVQSKTRLETNLQAAGVLPSLNSFEARAMRVVLSSLQEGSCKKSAKDSPPSLQQDEANFLGDFIYNSVTSLIVGEKVMIEMPTFYFPAGAGVSPGIGGGGIVHNHGEPNPLSTFRFAEPVPIDPQQNFRVEIMFPQGLPETVSMACGPLRVWCVLDGYMMRDVQ